MAEQFKYLYTPFEIGPVTVKNRLVWLPHITALIAPDGLPDERSYWYYTERAKGGVGLIIGEGSQLVHKSSRVFLAANAFDKRIIPMWRKMTDTVHEYGTRMFCQLHHFGSEVPTRQNGEPTWSPSNVPDPFGFNEIPKAMEKEDIQELISGYVTTAQYACEGGYDGIDLKAGHDGILRQFLSPATNLRQDEYGGSLENRMRLLLEIIKAVRKAIGRGFALGVRLSMDELKPGGYNLDDALEMARRIAATGDIDYMTTDIATLGMGLHLSNASMSVPPGAYVYTAAALKEAIDLPVITAGRINDPVQAEKILADGQADMVGMMRQLICDPETPNKGLKGQLDDIRHCMACNQGCQDGVSNMFVRHIGCVQNPAASRERELGIGTLKPAERKKKVLVVGGGPAGMKVAEIAARRGHQVIIYEKDSELGGQVKLAEKGPTREEFGEVAHWLKIQMDKLRIRTVVGQEATPQVIETEKPDAVVIATGASPYKPAYIPGADQDNVVTDWDVMSGNAKIGQKVIVFSAWLGQPAASAAEILANDGKQVEIVTPSFFVGADLDGPSWAPVNQRLKDKGVVFTPHSAIIQINGNTVSLLDILSLKPAERTGIDTVVLSTPTKPNDELYFALKGKIAELYRIGDCMAPGKVDTAIYQGEMVGRQL